jgi:ribulose-phosphate 3-epimerase
MIENPQNFIDRFIDLGAEIIHVHYEGNNHINSLINRIKEKGAKASVVINPGTPVSFLEEVLSIVDMVLVMTVNPGYTGQKFIGQSAEKISKLHFLREENGYNFEIAVDGGVNKNNAGTLVKMGADFLIMGAAVFRSEDPENVINYIKGLKR